MLLLARLASPEEKKEEEKKVQASAEEKKEEEKETVQRQVIANEPEEEAVQKTSEDLEKEKEKEEEDKTAVMPKTETPDKVPESSFEQQLKKNKNRGFALPKEVLREMNTGIGADFGNVHVHNDEEAAALNQQIGAKAFTHGNDIYFNRGKYDTDTTAGKELLAHELTHVVQQQAAPVVANQPSHSSTASVVQRQSSTPLPAGVVPDKKSKVAKFKDSGFLIKILPDATAKKGATDVKENGAVTKGDIKVAVSYQTEGDNVVSVSVSRELIIQTIYGYKAKGTDTSAYGRGTTEEDKKTGHTTLKFHEGSHGQDYLAYIANNPFPVLSIKEPISKQDYETKYAAWQEEVKIYQDNMKADSEKKTDHVGEPMD